MSDYSVKIFQGGIVVAEVSGPDREAVAREAAHYAMVYGQDGPPIEIKVSGFHPETETR